MILGNFRNTFRGTQSENRFFRWALMAALLVIMLQACSSFSQKTTVVMIPPQMQNKGSLGPETASEEVMVSWGMYLATLLGNVTPKSVDFLQEALASNLSGSMYQPVLDSVREQAETLKLEQISVSFQPNGASWDPNRKLVIVTGEHMTRGVRGATTREERTYEMRFIVRNYRVLLDDIKVYRGEYNPRKSQEKV